MKKFLINTIIVLTLIFGLDKLLIPWMNQLPFSTSDQRIHQLLQKQLNQSVFIIGSSKPFYGLSAAILEEKLGQSHYNMSFTGSSIMFHLDVLKWSITNNPNLKKVVLGIDGDEYLLQDPIVNYRYDLLYPLVKYDTINQIVSEYHDKPLWLTRSLLAYRLAENTPNTFYETLPPKEVPMNNHGDGIQDKFMIEKRALKITDYFDDESMISSEYLSTFQEAINLCQANHIELELVFMPDYGYRNTALPSFYKQFKLPMWIVPDSIIQQPKYFHDSGHLNTQGAGVFTDNLVRHPTSLK